MAFDPVAYIDQPRWRTSRLGLQRERRLLERVGRPQDRMRFVHVAGTNGKGSVCSYLASVLQASGYRTGLFTSPSIEDFEERIRIDGANILYDDLVDATMKVRDAADTMDDHPTGFELMCAVAMVHFAARECDIAVMEVGLGGTHDATNVIGPPEVSVITRIGLDHTEVLGGTLGAIALEKAGIVKRNSPVVSWPQDIEARAVVESVCEQKRAPLFFADFSQLSLEPLVLPCDCSDGGARAHAATGGLAKPERATPVRRFRYCDEAFETGLLASYQPSNAALAIDAVRVLRDKGWAISSSALHAGIAAARWPGRFERLMASPLVIVDGAHNPQGVQALMETLSEVLPGIRPVFIVGALADKDYRSMMQEAIPSAAGFVTTPVQNERTLSGEELAKTISDAMKASSANDAVPIRTVDDAKEAVELAIALAGGEGAVCAFGSLYLIGEVKQAVRGRLAVRAENA